LRGEVPAGLVSQIADDSRLDVDSFAHVRKLRTDALKRKRL
jgi:hypothetical protein